MINALCIYNLVIGTISKSNFSPLYFLEICNYNYSVFIVFQKEEKFPCIRDDDGFECDDIDLITSWISKTLAEITSKKEFKNRDLRISLFTLIVMHIQLLIGLGWYFMSPWYKSIKASGIDASNRFHLRNCLNFKTCFNSTHKRSN